MIFKRRLHGPREENPRKFSFWAVLRHFLMVFGGLVFILIAGIIMSFYSAFDMRGVVKPLPKQFILTYELTGAMPEIARGAALVGEIFGYEYDLHEFLKALARAKTDKRVKALAVHIRDGAYSLSQIDVLRKAVIDFRNSGKKAYAYTEAFGDLSNGMGEYWLASAFDKIWVQPVGTVSLSGIRIEQPFVKDVLDKVGVEPQIIRRKSYKTGPEMYLRDGMSAENSETLIAIAKDMMDRILGDIAKARNLPMEEMARIVNTSPLTVEEAYKFGLVDKIGYGDEIEAKLKQDYTVSDFVSLDAYGSPPDLKAKAAVAVVVIDGMILSGDMAANTQIGNVLAIPSDVADAFAIADAIRTAAEDGTTKVIMLWINSPGGSPTASETIRRAVVYAREKGKYVIAAMGDVAASGGYWIAVNANQIIASDLTITGSIGVYGGKMNFAGLWDKIGVNWDAVEIGQNAAMWSPNTGYDASERARLEVMMDHIYDAFKSRVAEGRNMDADAVEEVAQGRAWMGNAARDRGLVDLNGGFDFALRRAAAEAGGLDWKTMPLLVLPAVDDPFAELLRFVGVKAGWNNFSIPRVMLPASLAPFMYKDAVVTAPILDVQF